MNPNKFWVFGPSIFWWLWNTQEQLWYRLTIGWSDGRLGVVWSVLWIMRSGTLRRTLSVPGPRSHHSGSGVSFEAAEIGSVWFGALVFPTRLLIRIWFVTNVLIEPHICMPHRKIAMVCYVRFLYFLKLLRWIACWANVGFKELCHASAN